MELAPCTDQIRAGCQGFSGPFPSAFLDKSLIRTGAKIKAGTELQKIILFRKKSAIERGILKISG
jgi:hypothetical protein